MRLMTCMSSIFEGRNRNRFLSSRNALRLFLIVVLGSVICLLYVQGTKNPTCPCPTHNDGNAYEHKRVIPVAAKENIREARTPTIAAQVSDSGESNKILAEGSDPAQHDLVQERKAAQSEPLEFPRLFEVPQCDAFENETIPNGVCQSLADNMDEIQYRQTYLRLLKYFDMMATKYQWTYFIACGTLLGSWRHHDVIPWDKDMDIMVEYKDRMDLVEKIEAQKRFVPKQCTRDKVRLHDSEHITGTVYAPDIGRWYTPSIDIFFFVRNATHIRRSDYPTEYVYKIDDIFPLHRRPFGPLLLQSPRDTLKILILEYGFTDKCISGVSVDDCKSFEQYLPFVHRKWKDRKMEETLKLNERILQVKEVNEMEDRIPLDPFTLDLP